VQLVPTGLMGVLPWHIAFRSDEAGGRSYLVEDVDVRVAACAAALHTDRIGPLSGHSVAAVENPATTGAPSLRGAEVEVGVLSCLFDRVKILPQLKATKQAVSSLLRDRKLWHFACHSTASFERPLQSKILLAGNDAFSTADFLRLRNVQPELVVLSACELARLSRKHLGINLGMSTVLLLGTAARGVVAAAWPVRDAVATVLMIRFYELLAGGRKPGEAAWNAQTWLKERDGAMVAKYLEEELLVRIAGKAQPKIQIELRELARRICGCGSFDDPLWWGSFTYAGV
jgi:CHAT domain-containing protein